MLQKVEVYNYAGYKVHTFAVLESVKADYFVERIDGLTPVKGEFGLRPHINYSGSSIETTRVGPRTIIFTLRYGAGPGMVEALRRALYRYSDPKSFMTLKFVYEGDAPNYQIRCYLEDFQSGIFEKDPTITLSLLCPDPYFYSVENVTVNLKTGQTIENPYQLGDAETGFYVVINANPKATYYSIENGIDPPLIWMGQLLSGETLEVNTVLGNKYIKVRKENGTQTSGLGGIIEGSMSMTVGGPRNSFNVSTQKSDILASYQLSVRPKWVGL